MVKACSWVSRGEKQGMHNPFYMWPRACTTRWCVCISPQARGLSCQVTQSKKMVSECLLWVGPCPRHSVCLCELDCVSWCVCVCVCVCVSTEGGGAEPSFPPLEVSKKIVWVIHQPHPPSFGPAVARAQRGKFLGGRWSGELRQ